MPRLKLIIALAGVSLVAVIAYKSIQHATRDKSVIPQSAWTDSEHVFPATKYLFPGLGDMLNAYAISTVSFEKGDFDLLKVEGVFPKCRYFSFSLHTATFTPETYNFVDHEIIPDEGHINPFIPGNERLEGQKYTVYFAKEGVKLPVSLKNVRYVPAHMFDQPGFFGTRNYRADDDTPLGEAARPFPVVTALHEDMSPGIAPPALRGIPGHAMNYFNFDLYEAGYDRHMAFQRNHAPANSVDFLYYLGDGMGPNKDTRYMLANLGGDFSKVAVVGIPKPPSHEVTRHGEPFTGGKNVRYWSFCHAEGRMGMVNDCITDDRMNTNSDGSVTLVVGPETIRDAAESAGLNFLPWTRNRTLYKPVMSFMYRGNKTYDASRIGKKTSLVFRQILADPDWDGAIIKKARRHFEWMDESSEDFTPTQADKAEVMLGEWGPRGFVIDEAGFLVGLKRGDFGKAFTSRYDQSGQ